MFRSLTFALVATTLTLFLPDATAAGLDDLYTKPPSKTSLSEWLRRQYKDESFNKSYAIVVGIGDYDGHDKLSAPAKDAVRVRDFLRDAADFDFIVTLTDEKATRKRIEALMEQWFPENVSPNDRFLFYFSGHGETRTFPDKKKRGYLVLKSSSKRQWSEMIDMPRMRQWAENLGHARHTLFVLDACFSGLAAYQSSGDKREKTFERLRQPGHHIITAGIEDEKSYSFDGASLFTSAFLAAARGNDVSPDDDIVSLDEIMIKINEAIDQKRAELGDKIKMSPHRWDTRTENNGGAFFFLRQSIAKEQVALSRTAVTGTVQSKGDDAATSAVALAAYKRGLNYLQRSDLRFGDAIREFTETIRIDPNFAAAYAQRGRTYWLKRNHDYAMIELDAPLENVSALRQEFTSSDGEYRRATERATADLEKAVQLDPASAVARINRGEYLLDVKALERALDDFGHAIHVDPTLAIAYAYRGRVYLEKHDFREAIDNFGQALILDPKLAMASTYRGEAFRLQGNFSTAIGNYKSALQVDPDQHLATVGIKTILTNYRSQGEALLKANDLDRAIDAFTAIIVQDRTDASALLRRGDAYKRKKEFARAIDDYSSAIKLDPQALTYAKRGDAYSAWGQPDRASRDYNIARALSPNDALPANGMRRFNHDRPTASRSQANSPR
jgi:tetratricopeptide (TPR) repeat protein